MQHQGYKIRDQHGVYFITFAVVQWVDVFTRFCYAETITDSLKYCIEKKALKVHAWCLMSNHLHLIISSEKMKLSDILRDFKKFTSHEILKQIENNKEESRRDWMLWIFKSAGARNNRNDKYQFWQQDNRPIQLETTSFTLTKLEYLHNNPVQAGIVEKPEAYSLSSAKDYHNQKGIVPIEHLTAAYTLHKPY
jgi:putative transposase